VTATERILDALSARSCRPKQSGSYWSARCPAHEDRNPSLTVRPIEGMALVKCHREPSCDTADVMAALGLEMADLYDERGRASYSYTDRTGAPTRTVHRKVDATADKRFTQSGQTSGQTELYRLPKVIAAVAAGTTVYLVEGEKDVHALESLGGVATTSPMGASNWAKVDRSPLVGAHVIVVPDQDEAGARYCRDVVATLTNLAASVRLGRPKAGKDAADHVAAGHDLDDLDVRDPPPTHRTVKLTPASSIKVRPVRWLWDGRVALGTLALLGGREGIGKSTIGYTLAGDIARGRLPGVHAGTARSVIVCATEDSWEHTIKPRLMAADADCDLVYRVDVATPEGVDTSLSLPKDLVGLEQRVREVNAALILLDPLMSRLDATLDTHRDAEVRLALEPLVRVADNTQAAIVGLIHVNKSQSTDPLTLLMASRAFAAVARAVLFVMTDPDDESTRLLGQPKNNLGRTDLPTLTFRIEGAHVADTDEGAVWTGHVVWQGDRAETIREVLESAGEGTEARTATGEAADWLTDWLTSVGGTDESARIKEAGRKAGHSQSSLKRARTRIGATTDSHGFPRQTYWTLPGTAVQSDQPSGTSPGESGPTEPTGPTAVQQQPVGPVGSVSPVSPPLPLAGPTDTTPSWQRRLRAKDAAIADGVITENDPTPVEYLRRYGVGA